LIEEFSAVVTGQSVQELQFKLISRYKKVEDKPVEAGTLGIGHGSREVRSKTAVEG
jgi:hypothetical protein